jgi:hypothetical protein
MTKSRGLKHIERHGHLRDGAAFSPEYRAWKAMIERCENPRCKFYRNYGGRGISVHASWRKSFATFLADTGNRPTDKHSLDRIDNDRGYEPGNVRWALRCQQNRNRRGLRLLTFQGRTACAQEWADITGIRVTTIVSRLVRGWSVERALTTEVAK